MGRRRRRKGAIFITGRKDKREERDFFLLYAPSLLPHFKDTRMNPRRKRKEGVEEEGERRYIRRPKKTLEERGEGRLPPPSPSPKWSRSVFPALPPPQYIVIVPKHEASMHSTPLCMGPLPSSSSSSSSSSSFLPLCGWRAMSRKRGEGEKYVRRGRLVACFL